MKQGNTKHVSSFYIISKILLLIFHSLENLMFDPVNT